MGGKVRSHVNKIEEKVRLFCEANGIAGKVRSHCKSNGVSSAIAL
ncbi:MAG: hypothetical protein ACTS2F_01260 [Thainema sp.]